MGIIYKGGIPYGGGGSGGGVDPSIIDTKIEAAIDNLDTSGNITTASIDSTVGSILFKTSLAEENGIIELGNTDDILVKPITDAHINSLFD